MVLRQGFGISVMSLLLIVLSLSLFPPNEFSRIGKLQQNSKLVSTGMWAGTDYAAAANASQDKLYLLKVGIK